MRIHLAEIQKQDIGQRYEIRAADGAALAWTERDDFADILTKRAGRGAIIVDREAVAFTGQEGGTG